MPFVGPLDAAWLFVESEDTPMHVGGVQVYSPPAGAGGDYFSDFYQAQRQQQTFAPPFSLRVRPSRLRSVLPEWEEDPNIELDHHLKRWGLPTPGGREELDELIAYLHAGELDMQRPLWEVHLIDGLAGGRFAVYTKIHHSLMDGVGGMRMMQAMLSTDPEQQDIAAPWAPHPGIQQVEHPTDEHNHHLDLSQLLRQAVNQMRTLPGVYGSLSALAKGALSPARNALKAPYTAPKTPFNGRVSSERRFASQQLPLQRIHDLAEAMSVTINDAFLTLCAGALQRYLQELKALPDKPLVAGLPVSVRPKDDMSYGTAVSFILASLETDIDDPLQRMRSIHASTTAAKDNLRQMPAAAFTEYTLLLMSPYMAQLATGLGGYGRPVFNLIVSNVPGPAQTLYYNGARLETMYPLSIVTQGQGLNITFMSYAGMLNIGFTACGRCLPDLRKLADYTVEELDQVEMLLASGGDQPQAKPQRSRKSRERAQRQS